MDQQAIMMLLQQMMAGQGQQGMPPAAPGAEGVNLQDPMAQPQEGWDFNTPPEGVNVQGQMPPIPINPVEGPALSSQLEELQNLTRPQIMPGLRVDPLNPQRALQGSWRF